MEFMQCNALGIVFVSCTHYIKAETTWSGIVSKVGGLGICMQSPTLKFKEHVGTKTTFRFMNKRHFRIFSMHGRAGNHKEAIPT
eukprot:scaffold153247_cov17-Prasinocladus_malaysianus.AAC.1